MITFETLPPPSSPRKQHPLIGTQDFLPLSRYYQIRDSPDYLSASRQPKRVLDHHAHDPHCPFNGHSGSRQGTPPLPPAPVESLFQETVAQPNSSMPYTYMELGYSNNYIEDIVADHDADVNMVGIVGSLELTPHVHIFAGGGRSTSASLSGLSTQNAQVDNWFAGIGIHQYITPNLNGFFRVSVAGFALQADDPYINRAGHDTVFSGGVRYFAWDVWELGASLSKADVPNADLVYEASALYRLTESLGLGVIYNKPADGDTLSIGARWYF